MAKKSDKKTPKVHEELSGFNIKVNEFGEIISNFGVDKLNRFLDENLEDKKLKEKEEKERKETEDGE